MPFKNCPVCKKDFWVKPSHFSIRSKCSRSCAGKTRVGERNSNYGNKWSKELRERVSRKRDEGKKILKFCAICGVPFYYRGKRELRCCSHICAGKYRENKYQEEHPNQRTPVSGRILSFWEKRNLIRYGLAFDFSNKNSLRLSHANGIKHENAKASVALFLVRLGHIIFTELRTPEGVIDVFDWTTKTVYELETTLYAKKANDKKKQYLRRGVQNFYIFGLKKLSEKPDIMYSEITELMKTKVNPELVKEEKVIYKEELR